MIIDEEKQKEKVSILNMKHRNYGNMKQKQEIRIVQGKERELEYVLTRKTVKNLNMRVKPDGTIRVSASRAVSVTYIDSFVLSHEKTLIKVLDKYEKMKENVPQPLQYVTGEKIRFLGEELSLLVETKDVEEVEKAGKFLVLRVKDTADLVRKEKVMMKWFRRMQAEVFEQICKDTYPLFQSMGVKYPMIKIRSMKSRWGSCQPQRGIITLNSKMITYPKEAIEYVVLHEFAHFIHPNHSRDFYGLVEKLMPDWKERKAMLQSME